MDPSFIDGPSNLGHKKTVKNDMINVIISIGAQMVFFLINSKFDKKLNLPKILRLISLNMGRQIKSLQNNYHMLVFSRPKRTFDCVTQQKSEPICCPFSQGVLSAFVEVKMITKGKKTDHASNVTYQKQDQEMHFQNPKL